jgi:LacI family transcriptional regulator
MRDKVKIRDIAGMSGVSVSTVSLVLNNKPGVSQETRARVMKFAHDFHYQTKPSPTAGNFPGLSTIGMLVKTDPDISPIENPFYSKVMVGIEDNCRRNGINLLFATLPVDEDNHPIEVPQLMNHSAVDGLLLIGTSVDETINSLARSYRHPIVLVDGYSDTESYDTVVSDNFRSAYQAVEYLIRKGHTQIGLAGSQRNCFPSLLERRNGYLRAMKENDLCDVYHADFNLTHSKGYTEVITLLQENPQITALFCVNDDVASSAIRAVQAIGKRVPQDISIVGFDDTYLAAHTHPALTTMHVDTLAMGRAAVHLLSLRLQNPESARMTLTIHPRLVERESVSALNESTLLEGGDNK